eukprot:bmy_11882T0
MPNERELLALAELYEDEVKCKASKSDRPHATAFKSPRTPPQSLLQVEGTDWVIPFVSGLNTSMEKLSCKIRFLVFFSYAQKVQILLKLWSNGFSLDDGELRPYSDPTNAQFLESVKRGLTPEIVSTPSSPEEEEKSLLNAVVLIDDSVPTTKIQIRLADGSRLMQRFNSTHRILDVRDFIVQSRPEFATLDFILVTSFPNKELTDESLTLQEADILNTVILQQLK